MNCYRMYSVIDMIMMIMIVMIVNLSSLSSSSSSSSEATDCMIARAIVNANTIGVLNNVKGNKDLNDVMIYDDV